jgi:hypothetical protein
LAIMSVLSILAAIDFSDAKIVDFAKENFQG